MEQHLNQVYNKIKGIGVYTQTHTMIMQCWINLGVGCYSHGRFKLSVTVCVLIVIAIAVDGDIGDHSCNDYQDIENHSNHYPHNVPRPSRGGVTSGTIMVAIQPGCVNL